MYEGVLAARGRGGHQTGVKAAFVPCSALPPGSCVMALTDPRTWQMQTDCGFDMFRTKD